MEKKRLNIVQRILNYLGDKLSNKDRYAFEQDFSQDPFMQDAMDGFMELPADEFELDMQQLSERLQHRSEQKKVFKLVPFMRIAAGITLLIGIGSILYLLFNNEYYNTKLAEQTQKEAPVFEDSTKVEPIVVDKAPAKTIAKKDKSQKQKIKTKAEPKPPTEKIETITKTAKIKPKEVAIDGFAENTIVLKETHEEEELLKKAESLTYSIEPKPINTPKKTHKKERAADVSISAMETASAPPVVYMDKTQNKISGVIVDEANNPLPGVNVVIQGTSNGVISDMDGRFSIDTDTNDQLAINFIGYKEENIAASDLQGQNNTINLEPDLLALDEVVVIGYGTQKKSVTTGAVSHISNEELTGAPAADRNIIYKARAVKINYEINYDEQAVPVVDIKQYKKYIKKQFELTINKPAKIEVIFIINSKGDITEYATIESPNKKFTNRAEHLIKNGEKWKAAIMNGEPVSQKVTLIIKF